MNKQFVTYEIAIQLKELGFNEPCFGGFDERDELQYHHISSKDLKAPLWQQAIDFYEEKYNLMIEIAHRYYACSNCDGWYYSYIQGSSEQYWEGPYAKDVIRIEALSNAYIHIGN